MSIKRLFEFADQYFLHHPLPHGIVCWRYLLPHPAAKVHIHRRLWILSRPSRIPLALFFLIEAVLWLRWVLFAGWRATFRAVRHRGEAIREQEGLSSVSQMMRILSLSLGYCIRPVDIYAFGLYKTKSKHDIWNYIFAQEQLAFHSWRNAKLNTNGKSLSILQDKHETSTLLAARGIPMAPTLKVISRGAAFDITSCLQSHSRLFCKPRHGSRSRDAFVIEAKREKGQVSIFAVKNGLRAQPATLEQLRKAMMCDDFLIQPFLNNHASFAALTSSGDLITMRVITENNPGSGICCYCATIEIPDDSGAAGYAHIILPIDPASGRLNHFPVQSLPEQTRALYDAMYKRMEGFIVPCWENIGKSALEAHRHFPDIYAIAWDYVATPEGPYLLEGNSGWGTRTPQIISGGLLQNIISKEFIENMFFFYCKREDSSQNYPINPQSIIQRLTPYNPPDTSGFLAQDNGSLLVQCVYWNTPQSRFEKAPFHHAPSQTDAAAWARLDNREELAHKLAILPQDLKSLSDTELILQELSEMAGKLRGPFDR